MAVVQFDTLRVARLLLEAVPDRLELMQLTHDLDGSDLNRILPQGLSLSETAFSLVQWASAHGRLGDLLKRASQRYLGHPQLLALAEQLSTERGTRFAHASVLAGREGDPLNATLLPNGRPFLDRRSLRQCLRKMLTDDGPNVLVVQGDPGAGKSYTSDFILYLSVALQSFRVSTFNLASSAYVTIDPAELAFQLIAQTDPAADLAAAPPRQTNSARYIVDLAQWLLSRIAKIQANCWFVLDGFDHPDLRSDTRDLVRALLSNVAQDRRANLKIVLLGCPEDLVPIATEANILRDRIQPLEKRDIEDFFEQLANKSGRLSLTSDQLATVADAVLEWGQDPQSLNQALIQAMEGLQRDTG